RYEVTIEDPKVFTRPWKISMPLYRRLDKNVQLLEFKCVEFVEELMYGHLRKKPGKYGEIENALSVCAGGRAGVSAATCCWPGPRRRRGSRRRARLQSILVGLWNKDRRDPAAFADRGPAGWKGSALNAGGEEESGCPDRGIAKAGCRPGGQKPRRALHSRVQR